MNFQIPSATQITPVLRVVLEHCRARWNDKPLELVVRQAKGARTQEQNKRMWAMLSDISRQVEWFGAKHPPEAWKDIITAYLHGQQMLPGIDGKLVVRGQSTSSMSIKAMAEVIECCFWFGAEKGVTWTDPKERELARQYAQEAAA